MNRLLPLLIGSTGLLTIALLLLVVVPGLQLAPVEPEPGLFPYTDVAADGREHYVSLGCVYCHSQQPRDPSVGPDQARGWGRASVPGDYVYDRPHLLGTMRTGPDLFNVGARLGSQDWHLTHLYQPRAIEERSTMPAYPFLFEHKARADARDVVVAVPAPWGPDEGVVVAKPAALELVAYLLYLDHTYPTDALDVAPAEVDAS